MDTASISFKDANEARHWFKSHEFKIPRVFERKYDWKFQWRRVGNKSTCDRIVIALEKEGYKILKSYGTNDQECSLRMEIIVDKSTIETEAERLKRICAIDLDVGIPSVLQLKYYNQLVWKTTKANEAELKRKVEAVSKKFTVLDAYVTYNKDVDHPAGYLISIRKPKFTDNDEVTG